MSKTRILSLKLLFVIVDTTRIDVRISNLDSQMRRNAQMKWINLSTSFVHSFSFGYPNCLYEHRCGWYRQLRRGVSSSKFAFSTFGRQNVPSCVNFDTFRLGPEIKGLNLVNRVCLAESSLQYRKNQSHSKKEKMSSAHCVTRILSMERNTGC